jgi:CheY-like chemotaxis protein
MASQRVTPDKPPTVLVVDDERDVRDSLTLILGEAGYNVIGAEHGEAALAQLEKIPPPDVIVLDLFMPEMNGWRFSEELKRRAELARVPVVVVTAASSHWGAPVPPDRVLRKPFQTARLLGLLQAALNPA